MSDIDENIVHLSLGADEETESLSLEKLVARLELLQMRFKTLVHDRELVLKNIDE